MGVKSEILSKVLKKFQELYPNGKRYLILDQIIHFILSQDESVENARAAHQSLMSDFVDWNEIRVSHPREIQACLAKHLKNPADKVHRLKDMLSQIFNLYNRMDLEFLWERDLTELQKMATLISCLTEDFLNSLIASGFYEPDGSISPQFVRYGKRLGLWDENVNPTSLKKLLTRELKDIGPEGVAKVHAALNFHDNHKEAGRSKDKDQSKTTIPDTNPSNNRENKTVSMMAIDDGLDDDDTDAIPLQTMMNDSKSKLEVGDSSDKYSKPLSLSIFSLHKTNAHATGLDKLVASIEKPSDTIGKPLGTIEKPLVTAEKPLVTAEKPLVTAEKPLATIEKPLATIEKPSATIEKPLVTAEKPLVTAEKPLVTAEKPCLPSGKAMPAVDKLLVASHPDVIVTNKVVVEDNSNQNPPVKVRKVGRPRKNPEAPVKKTQPKTKKKKPGARKKPGPKPKKKKNKKSKKR